MIFQMKTNKETFWQMYSTPLIKKMLKNNIFIIVGWLYCMYKSGVTGIETVDLGRLEKCINMSDAWPGYLQQSYMWYLARGHCSFEYYYYSVDECEVLKSVTNESI